ncbi:hypothetical protein D0T51_08675 [Parabacteroides sp. 52]|uniref:hypothetical protein n=1 Tax=unclassified Parabacteroides TaxID=2649774 RepID=UPI0013CFC17F|nr:MULTISPECIES: hypothetical protein [unclassified Parabacteroides]NDV55796.1 hypothetical protein [Parabacteroides sp. 52]
MKSVLFFLISIFIVCSASAQSKDFTYTFYGFIRGDVFYDTRANSAPIEGIFHLYPLDKMPDANGKDLHATPSASFNVFTTRLGVDLTGPRLGSARSSAKVETDFGGFSPSNTMLRIRQAYVQLHWEKYSLLLGQTWHPLFGSVSPNILGLSTGSPFQPFNRSPQFRFEYMPHKIKLTAATIWQLQYTSNGPSGGSSTYLKNSCVPELYIGVDYISSTGWLAGAGMHMISLKPRTVSSWKEQSYKVEERMTTFSYEAHVKYTGRSFTVAAKTFLASALDHTLMMGGYGIRSIDPANGEQQYTPFRHSTSWINFTYGNKWKPALFIGYSKNLGTTHDMVSSEKYGRGLDIDQLFTLNASISYNLPHWRIGIEYSPSTAYYGSPNARNGKIEDTHSVTNHRLVGLLVYLF